MFARVASRFLSKVGRRAALAAGVSGAVAYTYVAEAKATMIDVNQAIAYPTILDCVGYPAPSKDLLGDLSQLAPQPQNPKGTVYLVEVRGGLDKRPAGLGHRSDSVPICNAVIGEGYKCIPIFYSDANYDKVEALLKECDGVIVRINPGTVPGVTNAKVDGLLRGINKMGIPVMAQPEVQLRMGAKDSLVSIRNLACGMPDTYAYYEIPDMYKTFPTSIKDSPRVMKQNRGSQGEGIWICKRADGAYGSPITMDTKLDLMEAVDNHTETKTVAEFMKFCEQYIVGENGQVVDQRFLPRIVEGEVRCLNIFDETVELIHKKPAEGGLSATLQSGATYTTYTPDAPEFKNLIDAFYADKPKIMAAFDLPDEPFPLIWTADFITGDKDANGKDTFFVGEFNCSCVGITKQLYLVPKVAKAVARVVEAGKAKRA